MKLTRGEYLFQWVAMLLLILMCIGMLYPFVHMMSISLSSPKEALKSGFHLLPSELTFAAYNKVFASDGIWIGFGNTVFRTVVGTLFSMMAMSLAAYALSKRNLPHRSFYTLFFVFTMFFQGGLIPTYLLIKQLGLIDTRWVYLVAPPFLFSTFSMLIMRNFYMGIPAELEDSAKIDGANEFRLLVSIIMPLSKPILATVALWSAVNHWNSWFDGLIYVQNPHLMVLQTYLRRLIIENQNQELQQLMDQSIGSNEVIEETVKAATLMVTMLPILMLYPFLQKYFVKGALIGSLKG